MLFPIQILKDSYSYFNNKFVINNFYNDIVCNWIEEVGLIIESKSFIDYSTLNIRDKIKEYYNLESFEITTAEFVFLNKKTINNDYSLPEKNTFTTIIPLNKQEIIFFEDGHCMKLNKGELLIFCSDMRYQIKGVENTKIILITLFGKCNLEYTSNDDWWLELKHYDNDYQKFIR
tara:strand:+ start:216 stop:740 length:525 start_codon:yes stop_codon:yes gene_type:complete